MMRRRDFQGDAMLLNTNESARRFASRLLSRVGAMALLLCGAACTQARAADQDFEIRFPHLRTLAP